MHRSSYSTTCSHSSNQSNPRMHYQNSGLCDVRLGAAKALLGGVPASELKQAADDGNYSVTGQALQVELCWSHTCSAAGAQRAQQGRHVARAGSGFSRLASRPALPSTLGQAKEVSSMAWPNGCPFRARLSLPRMPRPVALPRSLWHLHAPQCPPAAPTACLPACPSGRSPLGPLARTPVFSRLLPACLPVWPLPTWATCRRPSVGRCC